jgi:hypothetical protein
MNTDKRKIWDEKRVGIEVQFHDWYHEGLTSNDVAQKISKMYLDYCAWKEAKQKAFGESFKKLEETD